MNKVKAIIVDDEHYCRQSLSTLLERSCPEVEIVAVCGSGAEALKEITSQKPLLVFLDIEMPHMNGFELLEKLPLVNFELIFTTSHDQYAIKAIRFSALDYLLKPIDREDLIKAVQKVIQRQLPLLPQQLEILLQKLHQPATPMQKIALPTMEGLQMIPVESIISCSAEGNYTHLLLKRKLKIVASRTLKEVEEMLGSYGFVRVHQSFLVNLNEICKYVRGEGGYLVMSDGGSIDVSRSRKEPLLKRLRPDRYNF